MRTSIRAAVVEEKDAPFEIRSIEIEAPRQDEVLVRIESTGVCHTDMSMQAQQLPVRFPAVFGHEGTGIVEEVGSAVTKVKPGDRVVLGFASCGRCSPCLRGLPSYCLDYFARNFGGSRPDGSSALSLDGKPIAGHFFGQSSFAEMSIAYERNVIAVHGDAPSDLLGPLGCGIQTGAGAILRSLRVPAGSSVVIFGAGAVGLSAVMAAHVAGATTIIAVEPNQSRRRLALELGATGAIASDDSQLRERLLDETAGGANFTVDTTGLPAVLELAVDILSITGTCGVIGGSPQGTKVSLDMNGLLFGRTVRGICEGDSVPELFIPELLDLHSQGRFPFERLIQTYRFDQINEAMADAVSGAAVKPVLRFN